MTLAKVRGRRWTVALEWKAADAWVGAFLDRRGPLLNVWVCLLPCLPIHVQHLRGGSAPGETEPAELPKGWNWTDRPCRKCGAEGQVRYELVEDSEGHEDEHWHCDACGAEGWIDGIDS